MDSDPELGLSPSGELREMYTHLMRPSRTSCDGSIAPTRLHPSCPISSLTSSLGKGMKPALLGFKTKMQHGSSNTWTTCVCIALHLHSAEMLQVLDTLDSFSLAHRKCLHELHEICGARKRLPRSYIPCICMDNTHGHGHCGPGEIFRWSDGLVGGTRFERMFPLDKVFSPEGTEVGYFFGVASFPYVINQRNSSFAVLLGGNT